MEAEEEQKQEATFRFYDSIPRMLIAILILFLVIAPIAIYGVVVFLEVPGLASERFGDLEPLPPNHDQWQIDRASETGQSALARGKQRETRIHAVTGAFGRERLVMQARERDPATGEIVSTEPDVRYRRKRIPHPSTRT